MEPFLSAADEYLRLIESPGSDRERFLVEVETTLARLVAEGFLLSEVAVSEVDPPSPSVVVPEGIANVLGDVDFYWVTERPFKVSDDRPGPEVGMASLSDDLTDIYRDVRKGDLLWQSGHENDAVFEWRFGFRTHWGLHASSALWALRSLATHGRD